MSFTKTQFRSLRDRWATLEKESCSWESFEDFVEWAVVSGFQTNKGLFKLDKDKPHSPENSYWYAQNKELPDAVSPFCEECTITCPGQRTGCLKWREYFVKNWNENIHRPEKVPEGPYKRQAFQYEHPDLVREGVVFECSIHS